jgi:hypothetical protein
MSNELRKSVSWSFSKLQDFEKCKKYFWLKHLEKITEPERVLRPGQTEHANDRGTRVHNNCEFYIRSDHDDLAPEAEKHFGLRIDLLRVLYGYGDVELEGEWGMDQGWEIAPWKSAWLRLKLDVLVRVSKDQATVIDFKTGKKWGNEVKHAQQLQLYALVTFLRYPELESVDAQLWYLDTGDTTSQTFTRDQSLRFKANYHKKGIDITSCSIWPANPNKFSCQWCLYGPEHSGHCDVGVRKA